jgi:hypothetical protein
LHSLAHCLGRFGPRLRIDARLQAASNALDLDQTLAPSIRSNLANEKTFHDSCNRVLEMLRRNVQEAQNNIARYRALAAPRSVDLFDTYEIFQKIMEGIRDLALRGRSSR